MLRSWFKFRAVRVMLAVGLLALIFTAASVLVPCRGVFARPCYEVEHQYFSDATYSEQVGTRFVTCNGVYTFGQVTQYVVSLQGGDCGCWD
ncbi:MAG TPA: hypothetical protein VEY09_15330 [Pyrinomonadaceae bacterium]|nr:hypothetical protein [Pyrinomonadaceae bacterium]